MGCVGEDKSVGSKAARRWRQYLAAVIVNIAGFTAGSSYGWNAPILPQLQSEESPNGIPPISEIDVSWLASLINLTRIFGAPIFLFINDRYGRKLTGYIAGAIFIISWTMLLFANSIALLYSARIISGLAYGGIVLLVPTYTSDFAEDDIKGKLGGFFGVSLNLGATFAYAMGCYTSYQIINMSCLLVPVLFVGMFYWLPESPLFLMTKGNSEEAIHSLKWFRNSQDCEYEIERLKTRAEEALKNKTKKISCFMMNDRATRRAMFITMGLLTNKQLSGATVVTTFTLTIFQESGSTMSPGLSTIVIGVLFIGGTSLSSMVVEKAGRRVLLLYSDVFIGACLAAFSVFLYLRQSGWDMQLFGWLPLVCLSSYILGMSLALEPLSFTICTEMVGAHVKATVQTTCTVYGSVLAFASSFTFAPLVRLLGQHGAFGLYSAVCFVSAAAIFLVMPETKNRSAEDVAQQLGGDNYIRSVVRGLPAELEKPVKQPC